MLETVDPWKWAGHIISAYAVAAVVLAALVAWLVLDGRRQHTLLDELEARGARRRSRRGGDPPRNSD